MLCWLQGGYPWTVITLDKRENYMAALEKASVNNAITDFAKLISTQVTETMSSE